MLGASPYDALRLLHEVQTSIIPQSPIWQDFWAGPHPGRGSRRYDMPAVGEATL